MYHIHYIRQLYILPKECIYGFCIIIRINSGYFHKDTNQLILVTEIRCDFFEVGTEFVKNCKNFGLQKFKPRLILLQQVA
jgi:hypothetical protein